MNTSRQQAVPLPAHASEVSTSTSSPAQKNARAPYPDMLGTPPVPPPRTSSTHHSRRSPNGTSTDKTSSSRQGKSRSDRKESRDRTREDRNGRSRRNQPEETSREVQQSRTAPVTNPTESEMDSVHGQGNFVKEPSAEVNSVLAHDHLIDQEREQVQPAGTENASSSGFDTATADGTEEARGPRSRHDYNNGNVIKRKETTFGSYILGQTLGEGEFGKVKLGWKRDGSIQVAIKLIRRDTLGTNPSRLPKIYREIAILRELAHPNIVRLHEMVETDRHIGIIMEYASGGELFDYILNNRYLKDNSARRLFAQLVSGVGYLHKKGIVHRDLKLENLLLDRNRNIIITDFGFANTFDPVDPLDEEIEYNLTNKEYVKRKRLDKIGANGLRRGDLMQTSCGSPCYAAPELVVSDSLYTGRKVDVWSCGVILYAMLAGYLPFDDDPANPDGDNINLLYKYIVTTPLTFPEYVTPHARDLLRRILVPDPRKRADLFEVARHSWLSEFSNIVSHITSSTTNVVDIANTTIPSETQKEAPPLVRSASVREPPKPNQTNATAVGGLNHHAGDVSQDPPPEKSRTPRDAKRRTVQVEYVAPQSQTTRGEPPVEPPVEPSASRSRAPAPSEAQITASVQQPTEPAHQPADAPALNLNKPLPVHFPRSTSDHVGLTGSQPNAIPQGPRPATGASMNSLGNTGRLPSRGSYGQPVAPTVTATNTEGRLAQPKSRQFALAQDPAQASSTSIGRPSTQNQQLPSTFNTTPRQEPPKGHKRSNTVSSLGDKLFGRSGSILGGRTQSNATRTKQDKRYPPVSMKDPLPRDNSRMSMDSRRSMQYPHNRKTSEAGAETRPRRFSLLPQSFSFRGFSNTRAQTPEETSQIPRPVDPRSPQRPATGAGPMQGRSRATSYGTQDAMGIVDEGPGEDVHTEPEPLSYEAQIDRQFADLGSQFDHQGGSFGVPSAEQVYQNSADHSSHQNHSFKPSYYDDYNGPYDNMPRQSMQVGRSGRGPGVLQKNHRKFADAYEYERDGSHHSGSSGAARKVMDFFRRRAKSRAGDDR